MVWVESTSERRLKHVGLEWHSQASSNSWWWFLAAVISLLFADGRDTIAVAAWIAPACLLRFVRAQPLWRGLAFICVVLTIMRGITYRGMIPIPGIFYFLFLAVGSLFAAVPYFIDRLFARRLSSTFRAFVFPTSFVLIQFLNSQGAHGSWGSVAYTQVGNLPLLQSLSVFGLWGIAFLIGWFASAFNQLLEQGIQSATGLRNIAIFAGVYVGIIMIGGARLAFFPPQSATVRVASLSPLKTGSAIPDSLLDSVIRGDAKDFAMDVFDSSASEGQRELLSRTDREARAGAQIVFWSEEAAFIRKPNEVNLLTEAQQIARKDHIYLGLSLAVWSPGRPRPLENKIVLIDPAGQIAFQFLKARPTPGPEMARLLVSDGKLRSLVTPFGRLSAAICYDMDFPSLMAQAGKQRVDIMLSPAGDWAGIDPRHTQMAQFRAIEQGFNLVRQANLGLSAAFDYQGHTLATMDDPHSPDLTLVAELPSTGTRTLYARWGDWFVWMCCIAFGVLVLLGWRRDGAN